MSLVQLPFFGGMDEATAPEYLDGAAHQLLIQNGNFDEIGAINKRLGYAHLPSSITAGSFIADALTGVINAVTWSRSSLTIMTTLGLYQLNETQGGFSGISYLPNVDAKRTPLLSTPALGIPVLLDFPYNSQTVRLAVFQDANNNVYSSATNATTGDVIQPPTQIALAPGSFVPIIVSLFYLPSAPAGNQVILVYLSNATNGTLFGAQYNPVTSSWSASAVLATGIAFADAAPVVSGGITDGFFVISIPTARNAANWQRWRGDLVTLTASGAIEATGNVYNGDCYVYATKNEDIWFWWTRNGGGNTTNAMCAVYTESTNVVLRAPFALFTDAALLWTGCGGVRVSATQAFASFTALSDKSASSGGIGCVGKTTYITDDAPHTQVTGVLPLMYQPSSRPFMRGSVAYQVCTLNMYFQTSYSPIQRKSQQGTMFLLQMNPATSTPWTNGAIPVVNVAPRQIDLTSLANAFTNTGGHLNFMSVIDGTTNATMACCGKLLGGAVSSVGVPVKGSTPGNVGPNFVAAFTFDASKLYEAGELGACLRISTGVPMVMAGVTPFEDSFFYYPEWSYAVGVTVEVATATISAFAANKTTLTGLSNMIPSCVGLSLVISGCANAGNNGTFVITDYISISSVKVANTGGVFPDANSGSITAGILGEFTGAFNYAICYASTDASGAMHRSSPYKIPQITFSKAMGHITIPCYSATWRDQGITGTVYAEIYRTTVGGSTYYLVDRAPCSGPTATDTLGGKWDFTQNGYLIYNDYAPDSSITSDTFLYTTGGVLDNVCAPASAFQVSHRNRLWIVDETRKTLWFTKEFVVGEAPGFNELMTVSFPDGAEITGLATMDDKLIVFKTDSIWVIYGDGPANTGQGSSLSVPQRIATDTGCIDRRSVVLMPKGLMFQSSAGIYMLSRGLDVSFNGSEVVDQMAVYTTITGAEIIPQFQQVRFTAVSATGSVILVYNYLYDSWSVHTFGQLPLNSIIKSCANTPSGFVFVTGDGSVWRDGRTGASKYLDDDTSAVPHFVPTTVTSAWVKVQGRSDVQGYMRARRVMFLGEPHDDAGMVMTIAVDYGNVVQTETWPSTTTSVAGNKPLEAHVAAAYNKCMSIQVSVTDTAGTNMVNGKGYRFVGLAMDLVQIGDAYRRIPAIAKA